MIFEFDKITLDFLRLILISAKSAELRVFFVGGIVRDNILNIKNDDIDLLLEGSAIEFSKYLPPEIEVKSKHIDFDTIKLSYKNLEIDIASTRLESYPFSGCLPVVERVGVPLEDDVKRRDFSVNSLYCELVENEGKIEYKLIDLVDGTNDIKNKTLRVLHDKSYIDDPTRILRGINFKNRFLFEFSSYDKKLIKEYLSSIDSKNASYDRIYSVFLKNLKTSFALSFFREVVEEKYYKIIFKNDLDVNYKRVLDIVSKFNLKDDDLAQFLISILEDVEIKKQNFSNLLELKNYFCGLKYPKIAYHFYKTDDINVLKYLEIKDIKLFINGNDLIKLGYQKGELFKKIFDKILLKKLENPNDFKTLDDETMLIKKLFPQTKNQ